MARGHEAPCASLAPHDPAELRPHRRRRPGPPGPPAARARGLVARPPGRAHGPPAHARPGHGDARARPGLRPAAWPAASPTAWCWPTGESAEDVRSACALLASRRAGLFGRAPSTHDLTVALSLFGVPRPGAGRPGGAPPGGVRVGGPPTTTLQRALVDSVPEASLRLAPAAWRPPWPPRAGSPWCGRPPEPEPLPPGRRREPGRLRARRRWTSSAWRSTPTGSPSPPGPPGPTAGARSSCSTASPSPRGPGATCWSTWPRPATGRVAPDQRGYSAGARPPAVADYAVPHLVADVLAIADTMEMETFDLIGHDWGGMVAWVVGGPPPRPGPEPHRGLHPPSRGPAGRACSAADPGQAERSSYMALFQRPDEPERLLLGDDGSGSGLRRLFESTGLDPSLADEYVALLTQPGRHHRRPQLVPGHGRGRRRRAPADRRADPLHLVERRRGPRARSPPSRPPSGWPAATGSTSSRE